MTDEVRHADDCPRNLTVLVLTADGVTPWCPVCGPSMAPAPELPGVTPERAPAGSSPASLTVAALLAAAANADDQGADVVLAPMGADELRRTLVVAVSLLHGSIARRPGGLDLWQRVWRERDARR